MDSTFLTDTLPLELAERLLAFAIVALTLRPGRRGPSAWSNDTTDPSTNPLHTLMCVLGPRRNYPDITAAALARCWWVDLDFASGVVGDVELLKIMDRLAQLRGEGSSKLPRRPLQWTHAAMDQASKQGFVDVLDWWYERFGAACWYTEEALTGAAEAGHLETLQWWTDRKEALSCDLNNNILLHAALGGHTDICDWWLTHHHNASSVSRLPVMDGLICALMHAIRSNDPKFRMFHWWLAQPFYRAPKVRHLKRVHHKQLENLREAIWVHRTTRSDVIARIPELIDGVDLTLPVEAVAGVCVGVLPSDSATKWLDAHVPKVWETFLEVSVTASSAGHVHVLEWIARHPMMDKLKQDVLEAVAVMSIPRASGNGHVHVLDWWVSACPWWDKVRHAVASDMRVAVIEAGLAGHLHVLEWWNKQSDMPFKCDTFTLQAAAQTGQVVVLEWWAQSGKVSASELNVWMNDVVRVASLHNHVNVLEWWSQQQQVTKTNDVTVAAISAASFAGSIDALDWCADTVWFTDYWRVCGGTAMFSLDPPRPQTFDWWIEYLWATRSLSHDPECQAKFHGRLFLALAQSPCTILLNKFVRWFGVPEIASKVVPGEPHLADQVGMKALQAGHVCMYGWWVDSGMQKPDPVIVETHTPRAARHVKAWLMMRGE